VKNPYNKNCKPLKREITDTLQDEGIFHTHGSADSILFKVAILSKEIYMFNAIPSTFQ
jgi:hypothetical protein